jgi:hypothetical protein
MLTVEERFAHVRERIARDQCLTVPSALQRELDGDERPPALQPASMGPGPGPDSGSGFAMLTAEDVTTLQRARRGTMSAKAALMLARVTAGSVNVALKNLLVCGLSVRAH